MNPTKRGTTLIPPIYLTAWSNLTNTAKLLSPEAHLLPPKREAEPEALGSTDTMRNWSPTTESTTRRLRSHLKEPPLILLSLVCQSIKHSNSSPDLRAEIYEKPWKSALMSMSVTSRMTTEPKASASGTSSESKTQEKTKLTDSI